MVSPYFISTITRLVKLGGYLGYCPYQWNAPQNNFRLHPTLWTRSFFICIFLLIYTCFVLPTNLVQVGKAKNFEQTNFALVFLFAQLFSNIMIGMQVIKPLPFCQGLNAYWKLLHSLPGNF